ncbi:MAG: hypothetical protein MJ094_04575 [Saccharofermentans sp.]|nr:hypothetical protein [Saccharofermentans sp.]
MKKILKSISCKTVGDEGSSLAIALFFFLLCSILCAGMLGMGLSQVNSAHTLISNADNFDINAVNPAVKTMISKYMNQIIESGVRYYPEYNRVNTHSEDLIGLVVEDLCNTVHETSNTASRSLTVVFDGVTDDLSLPALVDGRYGFELIIMMDTDYNISFCTYGSSVYELIQIAHIDAVTSDELDYYEWCLQ